MIIFNDLTVDEYFYLIDSVEWRRAPERLVKIGLENGINVKYVLDGKTIGMARYVTDGGYGGLIMDVVVHPDYQGKGYGTEMLNALVKYLKDSLQDGEQLLIQLLSAPGKQKFYNQFGLKVNKLVAEDGMYMWLKKE